MTAHLKLVDNIGMDQEEKSMLSKIKIIRNFSAVLILTGMSFAQANVTGLWQGSGSWTYDGSTVPCTLSIRYEENQTVVQRVKGQMTCDMLVLYSDPLVWKKEGSNLILEDELAGTWSSDGIVTEEMPRKNLRVTTTLNSTTGEYHEVWKRDSDGTVFYDIRAKVTRSP